MMSITRVASVFVMAFALSACTQDPAEVDYRGNEFYGHEHEGALDSPNHETYSENSPRLKENYAHAVEPAKVQTVSVSDLPPPSAQGQGQQQVASTEAPFNHASKPLSKDPYAATNARFIWPVADGKVILRFGPQPGGRSNDGINIAVADGEPIWSAASGTVVYAGNELKGYGNMVILRHNDGWMTAYAHARSLAVKKGDKVNQGDILGYVGQTGGVKSPQLHFAIRDGRTPVDPELYLPKS